VTYRVITTVRAYADIESSYAWLCGQSKDTADRWLEGLDAAVASLASLPKLHGLAREGIVNGRELRQMIIKRHRIVFFVTADTVTIIAVVRVERNQIDVREL
jgi:plasmid stabilization system protein ParE